MIGKIKVATVEVSWEDFANCFGIDTTLYRCGDITYDIKENGTIIFSSYHNALATVYKAELLKNIGIIQGCVSLDFTFYYKNKIKITVKSED